MKTPEEPQRQAAQPGGLPAATGYAPERAWTPSHREEVISALWFIVAFVALDAGCPCWVFLTFFVKACMDTVCAIQCAVREWWREDKHTAKLWRRRAPTNETTTDEFRAVAHQRMVQPRTIKNQ